MHDKQLCQPGTENAAERKTHWVYSVSVFTPQILHAAMIAVRSKAMEAPGVWGGALANTRGEKWLVRPAAGMSIYFTVCLIVSHLCAVPVAVPALGPHWGHPTEVKSLWCQAQSSVPGSVIKHFWVHSPLRGSNIKNLKTLEKKKDKYCKQFMLLSCNFEHFEERGNKI